MLTNMGMRLWVVAALGMTAVVCANGKGADGGVHHVGDGGQGGELRTDKMLVIDEGEGTLDIYDEGFVYDHQASTAKCDTHPDREGDHGFAVGCWPLGRLILHPEEHTSAAALLANQELEQLADLVGNLMDQIDTGVDAGGDPIGGGGDGKILPEELANRVYSVLRTWQYEADRLWMDIVDSDKDGLVQFLEASPTIDPDDKHGTLSRFNFADADKDGWLSETDVALFRNPLWFSKMHQWALGMMVIEVGHEGHDNITRQEYATPDHPDMAFNWEVRVPTYVKEREFDRLDVDGSETLDLAEAARIPEVRLASIITHGVQALMHACDKDGDGSLSTDEVVGHAKEFASAPPLPKHAWDDGADVHEEL